MTKRYILIKIFPAFGVRTEPWDLGASGLPCVLGEVLGKMAYVDFISRYYFYDIERVSYRLIVLLDNAVISIESLIYRKD
jgi:hypothetical protein